MGDIGVSHAGFFFEERDVLPFELYRLFCFISIALDGILTDPQQAVEYNEDSPTAWSCSVAEASPLVRQKLWHIGFDWFFMPFIIHLLQQWETCVAPR